MILITMYDGECVIDRVDADAPDVLKRLEAGKLRGANRFHRDEILVPLDRSSDTPSLAVFHNNDGKPVCAKTCNPAEKRMAEYRRCITCWFNAVCGEIVQALGFMLCAGLALAFWGICSCR